MAASSGAYTFKMRGNSTVKFCGLTLREAMARLADRDQQLISTLTDLLDARAGANGLYWECAARPDKPFRFALVDASFGDGRQMDASDFARQLADAAPSTTATFPSLGGDTILVAPRAVSPAADYLHLVSFLRSADATQVADFWQCVGREATKQMTLGNVVYVSTAGDGVPWLHARICPRPKYYKSHIQAVSTIGSRTET